jgi:hypothetical protein
METYGSKLIDRYKYYIELERVRHPEMSDQALTNEVFGHTLVDKDYYSRLFGGPGSEIDREPAPQVDRYSHQSGRETIPFDDDEKAYIELLRQRRKKLKG